MTFTPAIRGPSRPTNIAAKAERFVPMANPPTGARFAHFKADRRARIGVRYGVGVDDPAFRKALRNARKRERQ